ncbi:uncharacterized protein LOC129584243 [Paramacrobiotus metropolitanus]|uniref:uncharacterized protein LOC129584243 n=1 Tax=Paramacrobiotus metropolitanus TaxID=2943436 RepID=UPI002445785E|nr:uncharacterized protein LOC129584243 [Paramacrobiotus metropolitanus]
MDVNRTLSWTISNLSVRIPSYNSNLSVPSYNSLAHLNSAQIATLVICTVSVLFNGFLLAMYVVEPQLRSGFSVYLISLAGSNFLSAVLQNPLVVAIKDIITNQQASLLCGFQLTLRTATVAFMAVCHALMCFNRLWAILQPHSYRRRHTRQLALAICVGTYTAILLFIVPAVAIDAGYPRSVLLNQWCNLNQAIPGLRQWNAAFNVLFMVTPEVLIVASCPLILCRRRRMQRVRAKQPAAQPTADSNSPSATESTRRGGGAVTGGNGMNSRTRRSQHSVRILIVLTSSVVVCWTPMNAYYLMPSLVNDQNLYRTANILKMLHSAIDPLLFIAAMDDLRGFCMRRLKLTPTFR